MGIVVVVVRMRETEGGRGREGDRGRQREGDRGRQQWHVVVVVLSGRITGCHLRCVRTRCGHRCCCCHHVNVNVASSEHVAMSLSRGGRG